LTQTNTVQAPNLFLEGILLLLLFTNLRRYHPSSFFPSGFTTIRVACLAHIVLLDLIIGIIVGDQYRWRSSLLRSLLKSLNKLTRFIILGLSNLYWRWSYRGILSPSNYHFSLALKQNLSGRTYQYDLKVKTVVTR
jgi:hypothetical protein